ncbi:MFS transporter [Azomonas macrocytogenes]|uniref:Fucose permease n=1 Tax=Azomonas macrocytogenes TaxID=69962 RepID=A0A839SWL5_AZOMA|nr:MFS transporter [Azomonas macrocytogenes]MBB3101781.1 fucose permease [Azomonas macrocytogenes]
MQASLSRELTSSRWATSAIFLVNGVGIGSWAAAIPGIKTAFALTDGQLSLVLLAMTVGAMLLMPLTGLLAPRLGGPGVLVRYAGILFAVALALPGLSGSLAMLTGAAFLLGASNGLLDVSMNAYASSLEKHWARPIMSSFHAAWSLGGLIGASLSGLLLHQGMSVSWLLLTDTLLVGLCTLGVSPWLRPDQEESEGGHGLRWPDRQILSIGVIALLSLMIEGAITDWSGVYLKDILQVSTAAAATGFAAFSLTMLAGRLTGDRLVQAQGRVRILSLGALLAGLGLLLVVMAGYPALAISGFALAGLGLSNVVPIAFSLCGQRAASPAIGVSMAATMGYMGLLAGPPLMGLVSTHYGLRSAMGLLACSCLLVILLSAKQR